MQFQKVVFQENTISTFISIVDKCNITFYEQLASGDSSKLHKCLMKKSDNTLQLATVKIVDSDNQLDKQEKRAKRQAIKYQVSKLCNLSHHNIIKCYGVVKICNSIDWVLMEFGECSLRTFLEDIQVFLRKNNDWSLRKIFSYRICIEYFLQIARGMNEAHSKVNIFFVMILKTFY